MLKSVLLTEIYCLLDWFASIK